MKYYKALRLHLFLWNKLSNTSIGKQFFWSCMCMNCLFLWLQANQAGSSTAMELEGCKLCFHYLAKVGLAIKVFVSDRHRGIPKWIRQHQPTVQHYFDQWHVAKGLVKVDGTSFSDTESLVTTAHLTREICPPDLKYGKSKTNMGAQKLLLTRCFFPVCPRLDQNKSCPLGVSC